MRVATCGIKARFQFFSQHFEDEMAIKCAGYNGQPKAFKGSQCIKWNKDHVQEDFDSAIDLNDNGGDDGGFGEEMEVILENDPANFEKIIRRLDYQMHS